MFNYNAEFDNESIAVTYYKTVYLLLRAMMNKVSHMNGVMSWIKFFSCVSELKKYM